VLKANDEKIEVKNGTLFMVKDQAFRDSNINYERFMVIGGLVVYIDEPNKAITITTVALDRRYCNGAYPHLDKMRIDLEVKSADSDGRSPHASLKVDRDLLEHLFLCTPAYQGLSIIGFRGAALQLMSTRTTIERFQCYAVPFADRLLNMGKWPLNAIMAWLRYRVGVDTDNMGDVRESLANPINREPLLQENVLNSIMREKSKSLRNKPNKSLFKALINPRDAIPVLPVGNINAIAQVVENAEADPLVVQRLCHVTPPGHEGALFHLGLLYTEGLGKNSPMSCLTIYDDPKLIQPGNYTGGLVDRFDYGHADRVFKIDMPIGQDIFVNNVLRKFMLILQNNALKWIVVDLSHIDPDDSRWLFETYGTNYMQFSYAGGSHVHLVFPFDYEVMEFFLDHEGDEFKRTRKYLEDYVAKLRHTTGLMNFTKFITWEEGVSLLNQARELTVAAELGRANRDMYRDPYRGQDHPAYYHRLPRRAVEPRRTPDAPPIIGYASAADPTLVVEPVPSAEQNQTMTFADAIRHRSAQLDEQRQAEQRPPRLQIDYDDPYEEGPEDDDDPEYNEDSEER